MALRIDLWKAACHLTNLLPPAAFKVLAGTVSLPILAKPRNPSAALVILFILKAVMSSIKAL